MVARRKEIPNHTCWSCIVPPIGHHARWAEGAQVQDSFSWILAWYTAIHDVRLRFPWVQWKLRFLQLRACWRKQPTWSNFWSMTLVVLVTRRRWWWDWDWTLRVLKRSFLVWVLEKPNIFQPDSFFGRNKSWENSGSMWIVFRPRRTQLTWTGKCYRRKGASSWWRGLDWKAKTSRRTTMWSTMERRRS